MTSLLSDTVIRVPCLTCSSNVVKPMKWIKSHDWVSCKCGVSINLNSPQLVAQIAQIAQDDLNFASFNGSV